VEAKLRNLLQADILVAKRNAKRNMLTMLLGDISIKYLNQRKYEIR